MSFAGEVSLTLAFVATVISLALLIIGGILTGAARTANKQDKEKYQVWAKRVSFFGYMGVFLTFLALSVGCGLLVYCFITGDYSLQYVAQYHTNSTSDLRLLFQISGLWAGRQGSLLFWAWLISLFGSVVALKNLRHRESLDNMALAVIQAVVLAFVIVVLFSTNNYPFVPLDPHYLNADGNLKSFSEVLYSASPGGAASLNPNLVVGMSVVLEHWAMAIHPPTLFVGYAGLTVPFAYAMAALLVNDPSVAWVERSRKYALFSWILLGLGIGLGAIWAYMELSFGGYWGWDAVENASLLPWILSAALIHSFTVYRQRGAFKRWAVMCASLAFAFVIVGTFITRSGVVQNSVHTFEGDMVSLVLFLVLILASVLLALAGLLKRWNSFADTTSKEAQMEGSFFSKDVAYYFNNVLLIISALLLTYLTMTTALPSWLPFGGQDVTKTLCPAIARPLSILYFLVMTVGPLLSWTKTDGKKFLKKAIIPGIGALVVFVLLMVYFVSYLVPSYHAVIAAGGSSATALLDAGGSAYYFTLTILGFLVASLLFFNSLFMLGRLIRHQAKSTGRSLPLAFIDTLRTRSSRFGGFVAHLSMAIILVGLIGSSMYVTQKTGSVPYEKSADIQANTVTIQDYRLEYQGSDLDSTEDGSTAMLTSHFDVYKNDRLIGQIAPRDKFVILDYETNNRQFTTLPSTHSQPLEDIFVIIQGLDDDYNIVLTAWINPLISFVWVGFGLLMLGTIIAFSGRSKKKPAAQDIEPNTNDIAAQDKEPNTNDAAIEQEEASTNDTAGD